MPWNRELSYESLEGYINAKVFTTIAQRSTGHLTRDVFMKNVDSMGVFDIGGVEFYYDATEHNGLKNVHLVKFENGDIKPVE